MSIFVIVVGLMIWNFVSILFMAALIFGSWDLLIWVGYERRWIYFTAFRYICGMGIHYLGPLIPFLFLGASSSYH
jgi:hypothetical protein